MVEGVERFTAVEAATEVAAEASSVNQRSAWLVRCSAVLDGGFGERVLS